MPYAEGSCLVSSGNTRVVCAASVRDEVPAWIRGRRLGWLQAEYAMLPRSSSTRVPREIGRGPSARVQEIQRLIGRSLRAAIDLGGFGERTIDIDCDVVQADGGTRTASVTGAYVALVHALRRLEAAGAISASPLLRSVAAVSVGIVDGEVRLDLDHAEDRAASVDMNVAMTGDGDLVEVQGAAEHGVFARRQLDELLDLAATGIRELTTEQERALRRG